ncbi:MAG: FAD-binding oxidoreductase [Paracoccaceae bacterium]|nr:FAD-binding oxidoreductase [Paracoccaceae bacterium]
MDGTADILVIGAGIAGASAAWALSVNAEVVLLETEDQPGYHTTGRSAALFTETYGNAVIRRLTSAGRGFFKDPPEGFGDHPLLTPRGALFLARPDQITALDAAEAEVRATAPPGVAPVERLGSDEVVRANGAIRPGYAAGGLLEPAAEDIDVHALHTGFLRGLRARGSRVVTGAKVQALTRAVGIWTAETKAGDFAARVVVNAAGAWCDEVAALAGATPVGLVPKRRTAFTFDPPDGLDPGGWPATIDVDEQFFFRPDAGRIMGSPADETPSPPCDAQPDEMDLALGAHRIEQATVLQVRRLVTKWAGLRCFVADKTPVVGFDDAAEGFFWLAGQGGYGIQTSPALGRAAAALITEGDLPGDLAARGLEKSMLAPERLR